METLNSTPESPATDKPVYQYAPNEQSNGNVERLWKSLGKMDKDFTISLDEFKKDIADERILAQVYQSVKKLKPEFRVQYDQFAMDMGFAAVKKKDQGVPFQTDGELSVPSFGEQAANALDEPSIQDGSQESPVATTPPSAESLSTPDQTISQNFDPALARLAAIDPKSMRMLTPEQAREKGAIDQTFQETFSDEAGAKAFIRETDLRNRGLNPDQEKNPFVTKAKSFWNVLAYQLPSTAAATVAALTPDVPVQEKYVDEKGYPKVIERHRNDVREAKAEVLKWAIKHEGKGMEFTKNLASSMDKINREDPIDILNYVFYAFGQAAGHIPAAYITRGGSALTTEIGSIYMDSVRKIAQEKFPGVDEGQAIQQVIEQGLDEPAFALAYGTAAGILEKIGADKVMAGFKPGVIKQAFRSRAGAMLQAGGVEAGTEHAQTLLEQMGAQQGSGKSFYESLKTAMTSEELRKERIEGMVQGLIGGTGLSASGQALTSAKEKLTNKPKQDEPLRQQQAPAGKQADEQKAVSPDVPPSTAKSEAQVDAGIDSGVTTDGDKTTDKGGLRPGVSDADVQGQTGKEKGDPVSEKPAATSVPTKQPAKSVEGIAEDIDELVKQPNPQTDDKTKVESSRPGEVPTGELPQAAKEEALQTPEKEKPTEPFVSKPLNEKTEVGTVIENSNGDVFQVTEVLSQKGAHSQFEIADESGKTYNILASQDFYTSDKPFGKKATIKEIAEANPGRIIITKPGVSPSAKTTKEDAEIENLEVALKLRGIPEAPAKGTAKNLYKALTDRQAALELLHTGNKNSREVWSLRTGVKLPKTESGTKQAINEYFDQKEQANDTPTIRGKQGQSAFATPKVGAKYTFFDGEQAEIVGGKREGGKEVWKIKFTDGGTMMVSTDELREQVTGEKYVPSAQARKEETFSSGKNTFKVIGTNSYGDKIGVAENGLRAKLVNNKIVVTQSVDIIPTKAGVETQFGEADEDFLTTDEVKSKKATQEVSNILKTGKLPEKQKSERVKQIDNDIDGLLKDLDKALGLKNFNTGVNPEALAIGVKIVAKYVERGAVRFNEIVQDIYDRLGEKGVRDYFQALKDAYAVQRNNAADDVYNAMEDTRRLTLEDTLQQLKRKEDGSRDSTIPDTAGRDTSKLDDGGAAEETNRPVPPEQAETVSESDRGQGRRPAGRGDSAGAQRGRSTRDSDPGDTGTKSTGESKAVRSDAAREDTQAPGTVEENHSIAADDEIVPKGEIAKIQANIAAIKLVKELERQNRNATPEERKILARYTGWGGLSTVLNKDKAYDFVRYDMEEAWGKKYHKYHKEIADLLTDEEFTAAVNSTINAHYTDRRVIDELWNIVRRLGFKGGAVLEPSAGVGHFFGLMPADLKQASTLRAYELDKISGLILSKLYPNAAVRVTGYENAVEANNSLDLVISNVPFAAQAPYDKRHKDLSGFSLHNYFIAKGIRQLKPGGIGVFITSSSTLDNVGSSTKFRDWTSNDGNADFIGAIRLPNNMFKENAGTEVTTDIVIYQKRTADQAGPNNQQHRNVVPIAKTKTKEGNPTDISVNEYYATNPDMMLGEMKLAYQTQHGGLYGADEQTLAAPRDQDTLALLKDRVTRLPENIIAPTNDDTEQEVKLAEEGDKEGTLRVENGKIYTVEGGQLVELPNGEVKGFNPKTKGAKTYRYSDVIKDYIAVKDAIRDLVAAEQTEINDQDLAAMRERLNSTYDTFVAKYGPFNRNPRVQFLLDDVEHISVFALEDVHKTASVDESGKLQKKYVIEKAHIFNKRVNFPVQEPTRAETPVDALAISISYRNKVDLPYISQMLGMDEDTARGSLLKEGLVFENPVTGLLEDSDTYLSGYVRTKFRQAQEADDAKYSRNIAELEKVIPKDIPAQLIEFRLGTPWLPGEAVTKFTEKALGVKTEAKFNQASGLWSIDIISGRHDQRNTITHAYGKLTAIDLLEKGMNMRDPEIYVTVDKKRVKDPEATAAAQAKLQELADMFYSFVKSDKEIMDEAAKIYNDIARDFVEKKYSLPVFDHFPNASKDIKLRNHQRRAVSRALQDSTLLAHQVGTGKTYTMITLAMEMRRLGIAKKPMITVQNATLEQFASSFKKLYPSAKILAPTKKEMDAKNRQRLFNKIAYNDWDAVIIPQSFLNFIPDNPERELGYLQEQIAEIEQAIVDAAGDFGMMSELKKLRTSMEEHAGELSTQIEEKKKRRTVKDQGKSQLSTTKGFERQRDRRKDDVLTFEEMGVDALMLDEAHAYKKLGFMTKMKKIRGIDTARSKRAFGAFMKVRWIQEKNKGRNVVLATGTPITNTMAEVWTMMKFVAPDVLEKYQINSFDKFAGTFGKVEPSLEFTAAGKFKIVQRFKSYINAPELLTAFRSKTDVVLTEDIPEFKESNTIPRMKMQPDGREGFTQIILPQTEELKEVMQIFKKTLEAWEKLPGREKRKQRHVPLVVFHRAKQAAIDLRLIDPSATDDPGSKTNRVVKEVKRIYDATNEYNGAQLVFSDMYQSPEVKAKFLDEEGTVLNPAYGKERFDLYKEIKRKLTEMGIPAKEIVLINEVGEGERREALFDQVKAVLLGSSEKMGIGVNVQDRLAAVHHIDAPPRPMDFEQRNGRILRQGNLHASMNLPVEILTYGVEKTLDATAYQRLSIKQKFINQMMKGEGLERVMDDEADEDSASDLSFDQMMSTLSGSQHAIIHTKKMYDLRKLRMAEENHRRSLFDYTHNINKLQREIKQLTQRAELYSPMREEFRAKFPEAQIESVTIDGVKTIKSKDTPLGATVQGYFDKKLNELKAIGKDEIKGLIQINDGVDVEFTMFLAPIDLSAPLAKKIRATFKIHSATGKELYLENSIGVSSGSGFLVSAQSYISNLIESGEVGWGHNLDEIPARIKKYEADIEAFKELLDKPFDKADKLARLEQEVADLEEKMKAENKGEEEAKPATDVSEDNPLDDDQQSTSTPGKTASTLDGINTDLDKLTGQAREDADKAQEKGKALLTINPLVVAKSLWGGFNKAQENTFGKLARHIENWLASQARKGIVHRSYTVRNAVGTAQNLMGGLAYTHGDTKNKLHYTGNKNFSYLKAKMLMDDLYKVIDDEIDALMNVHRALDPEVYLQWTQDGSVLVDERKATEKAIKAKEREIKKATEDGEPIQTIDTLNRELDDLKDSLETKRGEISDQIAKIEDQAKQGLNAKENYLYTMLRGINDYIHEWYHDNGLISDDTYQKNKGRYIARLYEEFEIMDPELQQFVRQGQADFGMLKYRKEFEKVSKNLLRDPVYATAKRITQMLQTQAIFEYADELSTRIQVADEPFPNSTQLGSPSGKPYYGVLTGKYVPNYIAQDFKGFFFGNKIIQSLFEGFRQYDSWFLRQFLKRYHTVYNPLVQLGNKLSNFSFAFWAGVDPLTYQMNKFKAKREIKNTGRVYQELMKAGILGSDIVSGDLIPVQARKPAPADNLADKAVNAYGKASDWAASHYSKADDTAKIAVYISLVDDYGYSPEQARQIVHESLQNYGTVGKLYDFAAKTPIFGNPYIKFKADLLRIIKNGVTRRPLTMALYLGILIGLKDLLSDLSDEDEEVKAVRERRPFIPKIRTPLGDIPMTWQVPLVGEVNFARFLTPYYIYDRGDRENWLAEVSAWTPFQFEALPSTTSKDLIFPMPEFNDVLFGVWADAVFDRDFRGKSVRDPGGSKYASIEVGTDEQVLNALQYIARSQVPMFATAQDMIAAYRGEPDFYGRERNVAQAILNNIIKVQEFGNEQAIKTLESEIRYKVHKFESLSRDISSINFATRKAIAEINQGTSTNKQERIDRELVKFKKRVLDKVNEQKEIIKELEDPARLLKSLK